jgi:hypothetical protein
MSISNFKTHPATAEAAAHRATRQHENQFVLLAPFRGK